MLCSWVIAVACLCGAADDGSPAMAPPRVFMLNPRSLALTRERVEAGDPAIQPALDALLHEAASALEAGPFSVMDKSIVPPSGDKHDYMSVGPYWWPDPDKEDGLPYIRRDGVVNPERHNYDNVGMGKMNSAAHSLALAFYLTGEERYAERAALLLRTWFLDDATRMNPNLNYGQAVPGRSEGRGIGIIDTSGLARLVDSVGLLEKSAAWTAADQAGLVRWFEQYLEWLRTHPYGIDEGNTKNNHGTYYDMQVVSFALFVGNEGLARAVLEKVPERRIDPQIAADGSQPHELARTRSFGYSVMNLAGFFELASMGERLGLDLWRHRGENGAGIRKALEWMTEHTLGGAEWTHQNLTPIQPSRLCPLLRRAAVAYNEPAFESLIERAMDDDWAADRAQLLYPAPE